MNISEIPAWESLAAQPIDAVDERILGRVGRLYDVVDPVPDDLVDRLQFAITLDALHVEIATLQLSGTGELAMRGAEQVNAMKTLTFSSESVTTMVTINPDGPDRVRIDGWAAPGAQRLGGAAPGQHDPARWWPMPTAGSSSTMSSTA